MFDVARENAFSDLEGEDLLTMAEFLAVRSQYCDLRAKLDRDRYVAIAGSQIDQAALAAADKFAEDVVAPVRQRFIELRKALIATCVDKDKLQKMLPMALMFLSTSINLERLLLVSDAEPDIVKKIMDQLSQYFASGVSDD